jgi:hypothetical protein
MTQHPTELATVVEAPDPFSAEAIAAVLRDSGIDAVVAQSSSASFGPMLLPKARKVPVRVRIEQLEAARRVLAENAAAAAALDWSAVDVGDGSARTSAESSTGDPRGRPVDPLRDPPTEEWLGEPSGPYVSDEGPGPEPARSDARSNSLAEEELIPPIRRRMPLVAAAGWLVAAAIVLLLLLATAMALVGWK